ncbi:hypothetical protein LMG28140_05724 [Paraburkholderia metrosideri]|uniref:Uncharacterized protein n=1 Tax=Paraburkholderia metrosideri TaxID=580937 RepID=A0ABM8P3Z1_9BURK|nr:hypothetical protein LMG28140_05724 [Paraburkholderia metrosideri]
MILQVRLLIATGFFNVADASGNASGDPCGNAFGNAENNARANANGNTETHHANPTHPLHSRALTIGIS